MVGISESWICDPAITDAVRFAALASAIEAMVWKSETDGNPSVDADELPNKEVTEPFHQPNGNRRKLQGHQP